MAARQVGQPEGVLELAGRLISDLGRLLDQRLELLACLRPQSSGAACGSRSSCGVKVARSHAATQPRSHAVR